MYRNLISRTRCKGILSKAAMCTMALVCDEVWKVYSEMAYYFMARPQGSDVWGEERVAVYDSRHRQGIRNSNSFSVTSGFALNEENKQNNRHFCSNHILAVLNAFAVQAYFSILKFLATFLKSLNDLKSIVNSQQ